MHVGIYSQQNETHPLTQGLQALRRRPHTVFRPWTASTGTPPPLAEGDPWSGVGCLCCAAQKGKWCGVLGESSSDRGPVIGLHTHTHMCVTTSENIQIQALLNACFMLWKRSEVLSGKLENEVGMFCLFVYRDSLTSQTASLFLLQECGSKISR